METSRQQGDSTFYTSCIGSCGSGGLCVLKAHVRDGVVIAVEPDDRYNKNVGREDAVISKQDISKSRVQARACAKGIVAYKYIYHPDRILYPLKRVPGTQRGEGKYARISWDEALDTVAGKMKEMRDKYGPYSIINPYFQMSGAEGLGRVLSMWGAGVDGWGWASVDAIMMMSHIATGATLAERTKHSSSSAADMLDNAKLIVLWGHDPTMGSLGPGHQFAWYLKLAREKGTRVIIIDPRYTVAADVLADQWIPIKPGTDITMFLAMAYVLLKEDLWDKDFVNKHVDLKGLERWKRYIFGTDDGVEKTPEWAEKKCAVPAETIRALTRLVANTKPSWLWSNWGVSRKSGGEQVVHAFIALQALLGYWGIPGSGPAINIGPVPDIAMTVPWGPNGSYNIPKMYRGQYWAQAVLLLDKVKSSELSPKEYMRIVGWRADPSLLKSFNPKMVFGTSYGPFSRNFLVTVTDSPNDQTKALNRMEFITFVHSTMTPTVRYADIILPSRDWTWEEKRVCRLDGAHGFSSITYCPGAVKPPGETKSWIWIYLKLAERLGISPNDYFSYYTSDDNWEDDYDRYVKESYVKVINHYNKRNIDVPSWEEFTKGKFINCDELEKKPILGWEDQVSGGKAFRTETGKIETYSNYLGDETNRGKGEHTDSFGRLYDLLPSDWGEVPPMPVYKTPVRGMDDPLTRQFPLMLLSPHPRYRAHSTFWDHPWLKDHIYRHRVWISPTDAIARNIKEDDLVQVYNDRGKVVMQAYVTGRMMPGNIALHHGGWYTPDKAGVDFGASPSTLLGGDFRSGTTPAKTTGLVQVEKYQG